MNQFYSREEALSCLDEFYSLYLNKPIKNNQGGMKSPHMFATWVITKKLKPEIIIESGVWKGQSTWLFENASPESEIYAIDPVPQLREYTSKKAKYQTQDFLVTDWTEVKDKNVLVFFDDHQNSFERIKKCKEIGFKNIIVEDNYPSFQGDCYSPKKILSNQDYVIDVNGEVTYHSKNLNDIAYLTSNLEFYQEAYPIFTDNFTRWNTPWDEKYNTPEPLLSEKDINKYPLFFDERKDYTWLCYLKLK